MKDIANVMSLLVESQKDKKWVLQQVRYRRLNIDVSKSRSILEILKSCPKDFILLLLNTLKNDDVETKIKIPILTKTYHWFYTDLVGSADPTVLAKDQARKVWILNELVGKTDTFRQRDPKSDVMQITGDGMIIGFADSPEKPLRLAVELMKNISNYNEKRGVKGRINIRVGLHTGPVYFIKDLIGHDNFWGPGIIMTRRVMDLARPAQILASERITNDIRKLSPENKSVIHDAGLYEIKHGEKLRIYNVYGSGWGNKRDPPRKIDEDNPLQNTIVFPKVEIMIDIRDPKNMMCHHTWIWHGINVGEKPVDKVSYYLGGDVPREFSDLNVNIKDESGKKVEIMSVNVNKPLEKEFIIKLNRPLKPNQRKKLILEYDWEEPERKFFYTLSSSCKKFRYTFVAPKSLQVKPRILKIDIGTRAKTHVSLAPKIKYLEKRTEVIWQSMNLQANDSFQFEW